MAKKFIFMGKSDEDLKKLSMNELAEMFNSRTRRKMKRGFTEIEKKLMASVEAKEGNIRTHCRDMIVLPSMFGMTIKVHNGKEWVPVEIVPDMVGHRLGEFALSTKMVKHGSAGIGATKSSSSASVK